MTRCSCCLPTIAGGAATPAAAAPHRWRRCKSRWRRWRGPGPRSIRGAAAGRGVGGRQAGRWAQVCVMAAHSSLSHQPAPTTLARSPRPRHRAGSRSAGRWRGGSNRCGGRWGRRPGTTRGAAGLQSTAHRIVRKGGGPLQEGKHGGGMHAYLTARRCRGWLLRCQRLAAAAVGVLARAGGGGRLGAGGPQDRGAGPQDQLLGLRAGRRAGGRAGERHLREGEIEEI